jgi:hypothetical protein
LVSDASSVREFQRFYGLAGILIINVAGGGFQFPELSYAEEFSSGLRHGLVFVFE